MMILKRNCLFFNAKLGVKGSTLDWGQELGQGQGYLMKQEGCSEIINGLLFNQVKDKEHFSYGAGGRKSDIEIISIFNNVEIQVYDSETDSHDVHSIDKPFILIIAKETSGTHIGRRTLKMNKAFSYKEIENEDFFNEINEIISNPWFGYSLSYDNVNTGILTLTIIKAPQPEPIEDNPDIVYATANERKAIWNALLENYAIQHDPINTVNEPSPTFNTNNVRSENTIYFGSPGTGKSNTVDEITNGKKVYKTTFHPEYDYHNFVGGYKPSMDEENKIIYTFVPQIFTNIYVDAWKNLDEPYYLQIEEINRGNCSEIFGDLFQLLDRKYSINADEELKKYLITAFGGEEHEGIVDGKIKLPSNLSIIATMNTSDQSLFPMDSAFKRRWDWEYMPINYGCDKSDFTIELNNGNSYEWLEFLEAVNKLIFEVTGSPDKQIGNWFVNATATDKIINEKTFINKILFYLWSDVFKDEDETLFYIDGQMYTYEDFFTKNENSELIVKMINEHLELTNQTE